MTSSTESSLRNYGIAAPHGPNMTGHHSATEQAFENAHSTMKQNERDIFNHLILPDDSYNADGVYWADMPIGKRVAFVTKTDAQEAAKELRSIGRMMKADPLSPIGYYFRNMVIPGAGLLLEG